MNMLVNVDVGKDTYSQKCIIPTKFFKNTNLSVGDYVTVQTSEKEYICRVYTTVLPYNSIYVDNTVTSANFDSSLQYKHCEKANIPKDLTLIKPSNFERIIVKVLYKQDENIHCDKAIYEDVVHKILKGYVIKKNCVVNCSDLKLADLFHIYGIVICETYPETHEFGRLSRSSSVEIVDSLSMEQMYEITKFQNIRLGGFNMDILKTYLYIRPSRVLISGPSGCGKSSFVKKFCSSIKCFFAIIDGLKNIDSIGDKCDMIYNKFYGYLRLFPNHTCVLLIDHIDVISPYGFKLKSANTSVLVNMINRLKDLNVSIIATAIHRKNIDVKVSSLFVKEKNLGMPSLHQRKEIVEVLTQNMNCDIDYNQIAQMTPAFVGHDIALLVKEAIECNRKREDFMETHLRCLTTEDFQNALISISPSVLKTSVWNKKVEPVYWKDIGGMFDIKKRLQMCVEWPLHNPEIFKKVDLPCPHGVLLYGPPGCCKTTLARGLATECNANFFAATPADIYSPYVGESEKNIIELFYQARISAPSIIFLDEIDSLVSQRKLDNKSQGIGEKVLSALLNEMDGFGTKVQFQSSKQTTQKLPNNHEAVQDYNIDVVEQHSNEDVIVVGATNRPDLIDDALLRPGRFDIIMYVPPPNEEERESILQTLTEHRPLKNVNMKNIAEKTKLFSGADLENLCDEAAKCALRHDMSALYITEEKFSEALKKIQPSISKQQIKMYENLSSKYGTFIK